MPAPLEGRAVAITGASSGIGEATALSLAAEGAAVALGARRGDRIQALAERIEGEGGRAVAIEVDVSDEGQARAFVERAHSELDGLHGLVNNAGVMLLGPIEGADTEEWRRMVGVNVMGLLYCTHAALPLMREGGAGHVINVSSVAGRTAAAGAAVYNFTKFGVSGFSEALRQEALHSNIRVTSIEPGFVATELQGHNQNPLVVRSMNKSMEEIGDVLQASDIADAILYALSRPQHVNINQVLVLPTRQTR